MRPSSGPVFALIGNTPTLSITLVAGWRLVRIMWEVGTPVSGRMTESEGTDAFGDSSCLVRQAESQLITKRDESGKYRQGSDFHSHYVGVWRAWGTGW